MSAAAIPLWEQQAGQWSWIKPPLRPSDEDLVRAQETVDRWCQRHRRVAHALVLGATAELAALRWPEDSVVTGMDLSQLMLQGVWMAAPAAPGRRLAVEGNWLDMPFPARSFDLVLGDGSFAVVRQKEGLLLARAVRRVLRPDGVLALRVYLRPEVAECPWSVCEELRAGRIGSFGVFKFRLLMSLQRGAGEVWVADAWEFFRTHCPPAESLARELGWACQEIQTITAYRGQETVYWFPTLAEFRATLQADFVEQACLWPSYELGDRCPTLVLHPRS